MDTNSAPTVSLTTVGCKLNQYESEGLAERFEDAGFRVVEPGGASDVCVVNSCTVTTRSDYRSRQMLRRGARLSRIVVATGCYAERDPGTLAGMPEVDLVVGNGAKGRLVELVVEALEGRPVARVHDDAIDPDVCDGFDVGAFRGHTRAFVKIQDGCDHACAYCAVPGARGPSRSRSREEVLRQISRLADAGFREVVLTGVHIGCYEDAEPSGSALARLLRDAVGVRGIERVRLGSLEPTELTPELASLITGEPRVCPHLHVPLQSGSDRVLARMGRLYDRDEYAAAVGSVTESLPDCGLGADVIVGFPGESDEDFADTVELVERLPFTYLHVFSYSPRPGTPAADLPGQVPGLEKRRRSRRLRELSRKRSLDFRRRHVGAAVTVLFEDREGSSAEQATGLSGNYIRVDVAGGRDLGNRLGEVEITSVDARGARGRLLDGTLR
jgi:threonylcarbamoyladenosine tRNA methylthiotransferase MtaB